MVRSSLAAISAGVGKAFDTGGVTPHCLVGAAAITSRARCPYMTILNAIWSSLCQNRVFLLLANEAIMGGQMDKRKSREETKAQKRAVEQRRHIQTPDPHG